MPEPRYKWDHPYEWMCDYINQARPAELVSIAKELASKLDGDQIQGLFQAEMDADGYFTPLKERNRR